MNRHYRKAEPHTLQGLTEDQMNMYYDQLMREKRENPEQDRVDPHRWGGKYSSELDWFYAEKDRRASKETARLAEEALHAEALRAHEKRQAAHALSLEQYRSKLRPRRSAE
jgi:hypothetical protein